MQVVRVLGKGRAAQAQLVDAVMHDGSVIRCVEKVFAPGKLTRLIYRLSFQSPFAYQKCADAIKAAFFRRRVAARVLKFGEVDCDVAEPLYVRFDKDESAWVLAAKWIDGRGIRPESVSSEMLWGSKRGQIAVVPQATESKREPAEIKQILTTMRSVEKCFADAGLYGSGWQVSPRAMVSTANLLRVNDRYCIVDLESGIPAVLDPKYLWASLSRAVAPPFDDLDELRLNNWFDEHESELRLSLGDNTVSELSDDIGQLVYHSNAWKQNELAVFRKSWRLLRRSTWRNHIHSRIHQWERDETVDAGVLRNAPLKSTLLWILDFVPGRIGRLAMRIIGRQETRSNTKRFLRDTEYRKLRLEDYRKVQQESWILSGRISQDCKPRNLSFLLHSVLSNFTPVRVHRLLTNRTRRHHLFMRMRLLFSSSYRTRLAYRHIDKSIRRWEGEQRISQFESCQLMRDLDGLELGVYLQGFGTHLAIKAMLPFVAPIKVGGVAAFLANGNIWFLLPLVFAPLLRLAATLVNAIRFRQKCVPHMEAALISPLPTVGSAAFPVQLFVSRPELSAFLMRNTASLLARRIPIYGGKDSRTELALIKIADYTVYAVRMITGFFERFRSDSNKVANASDRVLASREELDRNANVLDALNLNEDHRERVG